VAYSVDWIAKEITIPTTDLTLISGTRYSLDMADFLAEVRRLEWDPTDGLWAPAIVDHTNTRFDFAGVNYAPFDDLLNGYTVQFSGVVTRVDLLGSNNDLIDVLIVTGVSVVPSNSAGLQIVTTGSGVLPADIDAIEEAIFTRIVETGFSFEALIRLMASNAAAKVIQQPDGSYVIRDVNDTKARITGDDSANSGRDISALDGS